MNLEQTAIGILTAGLLGAAALSLALALASGCLNLILKAVTRGQYNVNDCTPPQPHA